MNSWGVPTHSRFGFIFTLTLSICSALWCLQLEFDYGRSVAVFQEKESSRVRILGEPSAAESAACEVQAIVASLQFPSQVRTAAQEERGHRASWCREM